MEDRACREFRPRGHRPALPLLCDGMTVTLMLTALASSAAWSSARARDHAPLGLCAGRDACGRLRQLLPGAAADADDLLVLLPRAIACHRGRADPVGAFLVAVTFMLFEAASFCEIMRAGIQSIPAARRRPRMRSA